MTLIDGGEHIVAARRTLEASLSLLGASVGDISQFLVTHIHRDHYTQAVAIRNEFGTRIKLGAHERASLELIHGDSAHPAKRQQIFLLRCGAADLAAQVSPNDPLQGDLQNLYQFPDEWLSDGEELDVSGRRLLVVSTPGHTQGHVVFCDPKEKIVFAGDHVLPHITPSIGLEPVRADLPLGDYLASLHKLRQLPEAQILPAHGPVVESMHLRIDELLEHHRVRLSHTFEAVAQGCSSVYDVARKLKWTGRGRDFFELDLFNQVLAVFETKYHLDLLGFQGLLEASNQNDVVQYSVIAATAAAGEGA